MSQQNRSTGSVPPARAMVQEMGARAYLTTEVFQDLASDYKAVCNVWRQVPERFARYCMEVLPPVDGPDASGSFALGECFSATATGAVHCVIARESGQYFAKYVNLMDWADALLELREALECGRELA